MRVVPKTKKAVVYLIVLTFFLSKIQVYTTYAASLRFYNFSTDSYVNYTGKQVVYTYNNRELPLTYPGILQNGTALADYEDLFLSELGLNAVRNGDSITFSDGNTKLILTMGSKEVVVNDCMDTISVAPVKLKFDETVKYYVPTRYVAETFGFDYVWVSDSSTVRITKTLQLECEGNQIAYNNTLYTVKYNNNKISTDMPVIFYSGCVMAPAKQIFEAAGCKYTENASDIYIQKDKLTLYIELNCKIAYINEKKIIGNSVPLQMAELETGNKEVYVSLEFVADMLGYNLAYSDREKCYNLVENEFTGEAFLSSDSSTALFLTEEKTQKTYFEWTSSGTPADSQKNYLSGIRAYAMKDADVVELNGITKDNIHDFFDGGFVVFEFKDVETDMDTMFFSDYDAPHLNYSLLTEINSNYKLLFMVPTDDKWTIMETPEGVRVLFYRSDLERTAYPDDKVIIPLPEGIAFSQISDEDIYWENVFKIKISGNHEQFYKEHLIINPYYGINVSKIQYDFVNNLTNIVFETSYLCGYKYSLESGNLAVSIGKPGEIHSKVVIFDAGHGGIDPGAAKKGIKEKDINFKILNTYVKEYFKESDIKVYFTRETDIKVDLYERAAFASKIDADMFISLHMNSNNSSSINGTEVYYSKDNNTTTESGFNSYQLAKALVNDLSIALNSKNRGSIKSDFIVIKHNTVPAVLIELGYMTNDTELSKLTDETYQKKTAETIYKTITRLFDTYY